MSVPGAQIAGMALLLNGAGAPAGPVALVTEATSASPA